MNRRKSEMEVRKEQENCSFFTEKKQLDLAEVLRYTIYDNIVRRERRDEHVRAVRVQQPKRECYT